MKKIKMLGFVLVCGLTLSACSDSNTQSEASQSTPQSTEVKEVESTVVEETKEEEKQGEATYENRTLTAPDGVLKITGFEKTKDYDGNPSFYVFFDITNNTEEAQDIQMFYLGFVSAKQNTGDTTESLDFPFIAESPHQDLLDNLNKQINPGATVSAVYVYSLPDETKPVTFEFTDSMFSFEGPVATEDIVIE